jgi:hypothetical protein
MQVFTIILTAFRGLKLVEIAQILHAGFDALSPDQKDAFVDAVEKHIATNQVARPILRREIALRSLTAFRALIGVPDEEGEDQLNPV